MREVAAFLVSILALKVTDKIENIGYFQSRAGTFKIIETSIFNYRRFTGRIKIKNPQGIET